MITIRNLFVAKSDTKLLAIKKATAWKPLGRLPYWLSKTDDKVTFRCIRKVNRYLEYMERRLEKYKDRNQSREIAYVWIYLMRSSKAYQMCLFHRTINNWYWKLSESDSVRLLKSFMNRCRNWNLSLDLKRFYLDKGMEREGVANGKLRPIGSPTYESRMISKGFNDLIYFVMKIDNYNDYQHGYRRERGTHTALLEVWRRIVMEEKEQIYEFDFKSFFNTIDNMEIVRHLWGKSTLLGNSIKWILDEINYTFDRPISELPEEAEIHVVKNRGEVWEELISKERNGELNSMRDKPLIFRRGVPQGLSVSPILATMVMDKICPTEGLTMYADDGLIVRKKGDDHDIENYLNELKAVGIEIEPTKTGLVREGKFKFLGVEFDLKNETVSIEGSSYSWKARIKENAYEEIGWWFKTAAQVYGKKPAIWTWEIKEGSTITRFREFIRRPAFLALGEGNNELSGLSETLWVMLKGMTSNDSYKGYRYFPGYGIYNIIGSSTKCIKVLLDHQKDLRLVKLKAIDGLGRRLEKVARNVGKYIAGNERKYKELAIINVKPLNMLKRTERGSMDEKYNFMYRQNSAIRYIKQPLLASKKEQVKNEIKWDGKIKPRGIIGQIQRSRGTGLGPKGR